MTFWKHKLNLYPYPCQQDQVALTHVLRGQMYCIGRRKVGRLWSMIGKVITDNTLRPVRYLHDFFHPWKLHASPHSNLITTNRSKFSGSTNIEIPLHWIMYLLKVPPCSRICNSCRRFGCTLQPNYPFGYSNLSPTLCWLCCGDGWYHHQKDSIMQSWRRWGSSMRELSSRECQKQSLSPQAPKLLAPVSSGTMVWFGPFRILQDETSLQDEQRSEHLFFQNLMMILEIQDCVQVQLLW